MVRESLLDQACRVFQPLSATVPAPDHPLTPEMIPAGRSIASDADCSCASAVAIFVLALSFNLAGDDLRDVVDPRDY